MKANQFTFFGLQPSVGATELSMAKTRALLAASGVQPRRRGELKRPASMHDFVVEIGVIFQVLCLVRVSVSWSAPRA